MVPAALGAAGVGFAAVAGHSAYKKHQQIRTAAAKRRAEAKESIEMQKLPSLEDPIKAPPLQPVVIDSNPSINQQDRMLERMTNQRQMEYAMRTRELERQLDLANKQRMINEGSAEQRAFVGVDMPEDRPQKSWGEYFVDLIDGGANTLGSLMSLDQKIYERRRQRMEDSIRLGKEVLTPFGEMYDRYTDRQEKLRREENIRKDLGSYPKLSAKERMRILYGL
jgi:hypothetical protein